MKRLIYVVVVVVVVVIIVVSFVCGVRSFLFGRFVQEWQAYKAPKDSQKLTIRFY